MKKLLFILSLVFVFCSFVACSDDDDEQIINVEDLPTSAQSFLTTHFEGLNIRLVEKDGDSYDVYLDVGIKIEFNLSGEWDSVEAYGQALPQSILALIPGNILTYITTNYPNEKIYEINKERYGYEIELSNRVEIMFNMSGEFLGVDNDNDDQSISIGDLPTKAQGFLNNYFQGQAAIRVTKDKDSYDVYLNNGFSVEFDLSGDWDNIEGHNKVLPENILALIPQNIISYVSTNYQGQQIYEINKERFGYEIELSNRTELKFDTNGQFLGIDD